LADPAKAQKLAKAIADTYIDQQEQLRVQSARSGTQWLQQRLDEIGTELRAAEGNLDTIRRTVGLLESDSRLREAQRVVDADKQRYATYLAQFNELQQKQTMQQVQARIISQPRLPKDPSFPKPLPFVLGGFGLGLAAGTAVAYLLEILNRTFATPAEIEQALGVPVVAGVPLVSRRERSRGRRRLNILEYAAENRFCRFAESLRSIRAGFSGAGSANPRIIQFASPMQNEGKSTLAACVALSAADAGSRTILIDCDFRRPEISRLFGLEDKEGVADVLAGTAKLNDVLTRSSIGGLSIVPAGTGKAGIPDVVDTGRLRSLIRTAAQSAELVIVDTAAIEAVPDAAMISQAVDEVVLVVKWRTTDRVLVERAMERIRRARGQVSGVVLNAIDMKAATKYGYWNRKYIDETSLYYRSTNARSATVELKTVAGRTTPQPFVRTTPRR
jgi:capsular exopolysaccharide synthesis family protein